MAPIVTFQEPRGPRTLQEPDLLAPGAHPMETIGPRALPELDSLAPKVLLTEPSGPRAFHVSPDPLPLL